MDKELPYFVSIETETPMIPNFIRLKVNGKSIPMPIAKLTNNQLQQIGESWTRKLIANAEDKRKLETL